MLASDVALLRALLVSICDKSGVASLTRHDTQAILDGVMDEARRVIGDVAYEWNGFHAMFQLPHELLVACFSFLPFPSRVSASHVSRTWRTAAISAPELWADITGMDWGVRLTAPLVQCAFSRAGDLPLRFEYHHELDADLALVISDAMHRIASLSIGEWKGCYSMLEQSAPRLESLRLWKSVCLPRDFLARSPGKLAVLDVRDLSLPPSCRGISNLATLRLAVCGAKVLKEIFRLCPRLQSLTVRSMSWTGTEDIGLPPESLAALSLASTRDRCNTTEVYEAFKGCPKLKEISLEQVTDRGFDVGPVLRGVVELDVACPRKKDVITLTACFAGGRRLVLTIYGTYSTFSRIFTHADGFEQLRALRIPHQALPAFAEDLDPLPEAEVCIEITPGIWFMSPRAYHWEDLRPLAALAPRKAVLVVAPHSAGDGPTERDARALVAELKKVPNTVEIVVRGFSRGAVPKGLVKSQNITFYYSPSPV